MTPTLFLGWVLLVMPFDAAAAVIPMKDKTACVAAMESISTQSVYHPRTTRCLNTETGEVIRLQ